MSTYNDASLIMSSDGGFGTGIIYGLKKPFGSGDFTVARASNTAVRKNASGYYEPVLANVPRFDYDIATGKWSLNVEPAATNLVVYPRLFGYSYWTKLNAVIQGDPTTAGTEKVVNGGFDTDSSWTKETSWSISGGKANVNNTTGSSRNIYQSILNSGKLYLITYTISNYVSGTLRVFANNVIGTSRTANGTYSEYIHADGTIIYLNASNNSQLSVDNVSVKEVSGFDCPFVDANGVNTKEGIKLVEDNSTNAHTIFKTSISVTSGASYSYCFFAKKGERNWVAFDCYVVPSGYLIQAWFNLNTGTVGATPVNCTQEIKDEGNGWYRCIIHTTFTATATASHFTIKITTGDNIISYTGDGTSGIYICHAQLETGSVATSPIYAAVQGSSETRNADAISVALPSGVTQVKLLSSADVETVVNSPSDPYTVPAGKWKQIIML